MRFAALTVLACCCLTVAAAQDARSFKSMMTEQRQLATCPAGGIPDATGKACCAKTCGSCGGTGCNNRPGGAAACCTGSVTTPCSTGKFPCKLASPPPSKCPANGILDPTGKVCCPNTCGTCGGTGCDKRPGGGAKCCTGSVTASCASGKLPCKIAAIPPPNKCPVNGILDATGKACCPKTCGTCGGAGCEKRPGGAAKCCTGSITASCTAGKLPCKLQSAPPNYCAHGVVTKFKYNFCDFSACCPKHCGAGCETDEEKCDDNHPECCAPKIANVWAGGQEVAPSDAAITCRNRGPPCLMPPANDPCAVNPCKNGAACGVGYETYEDTCSVTSYCICPKGKNLSGKFCELACGAGTPCGRSSGGYAGVDFQPNDTCCTKDETCEYQAGKYGYNRLCWPNDRIESCDPNPCQNGGTCYNQNYYCFYNWCVELNTCICPKGFTGKLCETPAV